MYEFKEYAGIKTRTASSLHHDIGSQKSTKLVSNAAAVANIINIQGNPFVKEDMHNLVTYAVMPDYVSNDIENRDQLGRDALEKCIANRMVDKTVEFWDPQKKTILLLQRRWSGGLDQDQGSVDAHQTITSIAFQIIGDNEE